MSPEPAGRHVEAGQFAALDPLEKGGPPVDLAFVEAIGRPRSCRPLARQSTADSRAMPSAIW
jgi:hypothetical protein